MNYLYEIVSPRVTTEDSLGMELLRHLSKPIDPQIMMATEVEYHYPGNYTGGSTDRKSLLEQISYYADDCVMSPKPDELNPVGNSWIVPARTRVEEVAARRQDLNNRESLTNALGGKYWDIERRHVAEVGINLLTLANMNGYVVENLSVLPFVALETQVITSLS